MADEQNGPPMTEDNEGQDGARTVGTKVSLARDLRDEAQSLFAGPEPATGPRAEGGTHSAELCMWSREDDFASFLLPYKFGIAEMMTKINILKEDLTFGAHYCPIEHVDSRLKPRDSLLAKARRIGCPLTADEIRRTISDIGGVRIVCSFLSDVYTVTDMLTNQPDVTVVTVKDYVARPKPNGYQSLHLIVDTPVHRAAGIELVRLEVQIRTVAMDFWASLEHKIYYKYDKEVPAHLRTELASAAAAAHHLDEKMELLHREVRNAERPAVPDPRRRSAGPLRLHGIQATDLQIAVPAQPATRGHAGRRRLV